MLSDAKFLVAAVARKDFIAELCHFHIFNGHAWAYDGVISMHTKFDIEFAVRPHAQAFIKAISACDDESAVAMHITDAGRLSIRSGRFRAFVQCLDPNAESILPKPKKEDQEVEVTDQLLDSIKELAPFMSIDASRPWAMGLRIVGNSTYATNNIILVERWHGSNFPFEIIVPAEFVKTVIKIDEKPIRAQVSHTSLTFHYANERWIRTQLVVGEWPPNLDSIFKDSPGSSLPDDFFKALEQLKPFTDERGRVFIFPNRLATSDVEGEGASVDIATGVDGALFHLEQLQLLQPVMKRIDLTAYPSPCAWFGNKIRGIIVGQRM